jgi:hypothetical protein
MNVERNACAFIGAGGMPSADRMSSMRSPRARSAGDDRRGRGPVVDGGAPLIFGHALYEHLVSDNWTARGVRVPLSGDAAEADALLAAALEPDAEAPPLLAGRPASVAMTPRSFCTRVVVCCCVRRAGRRFAAHVGNQRVRM